MDEAHSRPQTSGSPSRDAPPPTSDSASATTQRQNFNSSQQHHVPSYPSYQQPADFSNLDEQGVAPPADHSQRRAAHKRQSTLEGIIGSRLSERHLDSRDSEWNPHDSGLHHRGNWQAGGEGGDLTEVAAPPPVQQDESASSSEKLENQHHQGTTEGSSSRSDYYQNGSAPNSSSPRDEVPQWLTQVYTVSYLIFFSFMGTLARLGVQWLTFYPGAPVTTPVIWANFGGSLIMGFLAEDQGLFRNSRPKETAAKANGKEKHSSQTEEERAAAAKAAHAKHKKTIPLYIGLATGFCGSFTSFSSFARDFFLALSNNLPAPLNHPGAVPSTSNDMSRNGGYSFLAFLAVIFQTLALSLGGLLTGAQLAAFLEPITPALSVNFVKKFLDRAMVVLAFGCWLGAVFLAIWPPDRPGGPASRGSWSNETWRGDAIFALVFAPLGCLLRFYASLKLNAIVPAFPLGTFAVNMLGTAVEGMCYDIQHVGVGVMGRVGGGRVGCQVLQGVQDGFCGCLTTVSTWVAEINGLKRRNGWLYAFSSLLGALGLMVVIMGSVRWSVGFSSPVCNTGYPDKIHG